jgi:hypothetical protein
MAGITVYTTTGNTYAVASGASCKTDEISPTGELAVSVYGSPGATGVGPWLASFGSVEAVYQEGAVIMTAPVQGSKSLL